MNVVGAGPLVNLPAKQEPKKPMSNVSGNRGGNPNEDSQSVLNRLNKSIQSDRRIPENQGLFRNGFENPQELNLETFDPFIEYHQAPNCLAFVLLSICKNIQVNALQAASLLANSNKYLSQLIIRGKKNQFQPVISMMSDIYKNIATLIKLIEQEESQGSVKFVLQAFKTVFLSGNIEVAKYGCRIYSKVLYDLANREFLPDAWEWYRLITQVRKSQRRLLRDQRVLRPLERRHSRTTVLSAHPDRQVQLRRDVHGRVEENSAFTHRLHQVCLSFHSSHVQF